MQSPLHPLNTTTFLRDTYLRYLKTIYPFQAGGLRDQFWQALSEPDLLVKGPLLEAAAPLQTGQSIKNLVEAHRLHSGFERLCSDSLPYDRPLYVHQQAAIEKVLLGRNVVVSTGTGSGKTEAFLIPILDHLLREAEAGTLVKPGVRALLLYPMNALANDQMKRLRRILANYSSITFGRYIGETPNTEGDARERFLQQFPREPVLKNELIARNQMQSAPPHILVTNYAMLEYLLVRPRDTAFFDDETGRYWRFIVLDEAHIYDGAAGIEIAMLLRRLKDRVVRSEPGRLRIMATSATLGRGEQDFTAVVQFASELFGEPFVWDSSNPLHQDVVAATRLSPDAQGPTWGVGLPSFYEALSHSLLADNPGTEGGIDKLAQAAAAHGVPATIITAASRAAHQVSSEAAANGFLFALLRGDARFRQFASLLANRPRFLKSLADELFPDEPEATERLIDMVNLGVRARPDPNSHPLLPARYHVFARALEGAFVCLDEAAHIQLAEPAPRLFLRRHETCPHCHSQVFEIAVCPRCGTLYLVGELVSVDRQGGELQRFRQPTGPAPLDETRETPVYFVWADQVSNMDEDEAVGEQEDLETAMHEFTQPYTLCLGCGAVAAGHGAQVTCQCPPATARLNVYEVDRGGKPELRRCVSCGTRSAVGVAYRFLTGQDAPVSVLATALYQKLPPAEDEQASLLPGRGRKLLMFADSRQDAAFFAPYLERTYQQVLRRRLILMALLADDVGRAGKLRLQDVVIPLHAQAEAAGLFHQLASYDETQRLMSTWLMQEMMAVDRRNSLEGLGLLYFRLVRPKNWQPPAPLLQPPWNLSPEEAWDLIALLLDNLRRQGAVAFPPSVDPRSEEFAPRNFAIYVRGGGADSQRHVLGWLPTRGGNNRLDIVSRLLARISETAAVDSEEVAVETLKGIWQHLIAQDTVWRDYFPGEQLAGVEGVPHHLSYAIWELVPMPNGTLPMYRCSRCRSIVYRSVRAICPTYGCRGTLQPLNPSEPDWSLNHYRSLYQTMDPIPLEAEEHTAQWTSTKASEVQDRFVRGAVNALSCSTTFELGVDVGDLQAVLMRNVPPTTANYIQRAGRAGRRTDVAAFALTYAQRRSHDLTHFSEPERMVAGKIHPPVIVIANEKIVRRHMHSVLLAAFLRWARDEHGREFGTGNSLSVGEFFAPGDGRAAGADMLREYALSHPLAVEEAIFRIVPQLPSLRHDLKLEAWAWLEHLWQTHGLGLLDRVMAEVNGDLDELQQLVNEAADEKTESGYGRARRLMGVLRTIKSRTLLGFLGSRGVLPKYGFPVDVVELKTDHLDSPVEAQQVELQRDLRVALSEYAPGSEVVAAKYIWTSSGISKPPKREWDSGKYAVCSNCGRFHSDRSSGTGVCTACHQNLATGRALRGDFVRPEFGFLVGRPFAGRPSAVRKSGESRPQRVYASRIFFSDYLSSDRNGIAIPPQPEPVPDLSSERVGVWKRYSRYGWLALVNPGPQTRGFRVCHTCGYAEPAPNVVPGQRRRAAKPHPNPRTGQGCSGLLQSCHLLHEFMTDVLELRFDGALAANPDSGLWYSLLYALIEGASEALGIRRDDLDGTIYRYSANLVPALVLFDNVPGGAGHVFRISEELDVTFAAAYRRMSQACCGDNTSCYDCLRNFRNQPYHEQLKRSVARDFLAQVLKHAGSP